MLTLENFKQTLLGDKNVFYKSSGTGNFGGFVYHPDGTVTIPNKAPSGIWDKIGKIIDTGLDVWAKIKEIKKPVHTRTPSIPTQTVTYPYVYVGSTKTVEGKQTKGNILSGNDIINAIKSPGQTPELTKKANIITKQAQTIVWIIVGGLVFLGIVLLARRR